MTHVRTFTHDLMAREPSAMTALTPDTHMAACMAEFARKVLYTYMRETGRYARDRDVTHVEIQRVILGRAGYTAGGRYYGVGPALFELDVTMADESGTTYTVFHTVRATGRAELRRTLAQMFRHAKIGR